MDLEALGTLKSKQRMTAYRRQQRELNALGYSDYEAVDRVKNAYLQEFFEEQVPEFFRTMKALGVTLEEIIPYIK